MKTRPLRQIANPMSDLISAGRQTIVPGDIDTYVQLEFGAFCSIASGLTIVSGQHPQAPAVSSFPFNEHGWSGSYPESRHDGKVIVENDVWIGQGVTIIERPGMYIHNGATIAAGAVVTHPVPPYTMVAGNPARAKKHRFLTGEIEAMQRIKWWDWPDEKIQEALPYMGNIAAFLHKYGETR